uniref:Uncharacterized protein n=1 Tax=Rhizophora mucronata TaxID=61149 RepID=A0A2P2NNE3_RHIMU
MIMQRNIVPTLKQLCLVKSIIITDSSLALTKLLGGECKHIDMSTDISMDLPKINYVSEPKLLNHVEEILSKITC